MSDIPGEIPCAPRAGGETTMYSDHFQLEQMPFASTADPRFFFRTAEHEEALAALLYGVTQRRGVVVVSGPPGTGKTLLAHMLVERLRPRAQAALILHTPGSGHELILAICRELGVRHRASHSTGELVERLREHLASRFLENQTVVAVIDEAQGLSPETLEHLRMLGNLEKESAKLLQIVLLGQPELVDRLKRPQMQQLCQRIFCHRQLGPLAHDQTRGYIRHRLAVAGAKDREIFTEEAVDLIHDRSGGLPRMINQIADNAMLCAYSAGRTTVDRDTVFGAIQDMLGLPLVECAARTGVEEASGGPPTGGGPPCCPATVCAAPPAAPPTAGPRDESIRQGAEVTGRLAEVSRTAWQQAEDLKNLLVRVNAAAAAMSQFEQASAATRRELDAQIGEIRALLGRAGRLARRLHQGRCDTVEISQRLDALAARAREFTERLAAAGPQAERTIEEALGRTQAAAETVARLSADLQAASTAAQDRSAQLRGAMGEADRLREVFVEASSALADRTAEAHHLLEGLSRQLGRAGELIPETAAQADRLERAGNDTEIRAAACEHRLHDLAAKLDEARDRQGAIEECSGRAERLRAELGADVEAAGARRRELDAALTECRRCQDALGALLSQGGSLADWLDDRRQAADSACQVLEARIEAANARADQAAGITQALGSACDRAEPLRASLDTQAGAVEKQLDASRDLSRQLGEQAGLIEVQLRAAGAAAAELTGLYDRLGQAFNDDAVRSLQQAAGQLEAAVRQARQQTETLTQACGQAGAVGQQVEQACRQASALCDRLADAGAGAERQTARAEAAIDECAARAAVLGRLLAETGEAADTLTRLRHEADVLDAAWMQRLRLLAEEDRQAAIYLRELADATHQASAVWTTLEQTATAAVSRVGDAREKAHLEADALERRIEDAHEAIRRLTGVEESLGRTFGPEAVADLDRRCRQVEETLAQASQRNEALTAACRGAEALQSQLTESAGAIGRQLAEAEARGTETHRRLVDATAAAAAQTAAATELAGQLAAECDTLRDGIGRAESAKHTLEDLRAEVIETLAPQAFDALKERRQQAESLVASAEAQCARLSAGAADAREAGGRLDAAAAQASGAAAKAEETARGVRREAADLTARVEEASEQLARQVARSHDSASEAAQMVGEQIDRLRAEAASVAGALDDRVAAAGVAARQLDERTRRHNDRALDADRAISELTDRADRHAAALAGRLEHAGAVLNRLDRAAAELNEILSSPALREVQEEHAALQAAVGEAGDRTESLHAAARQAEEASAALARGKDEADQRDLAARRQIESLDARLGQAAEQAQRLENLSGQVPQIQQELSGQARLAVQLKQELERAVRRLSHERRLTEAAINRLDALRLEQVDLADLYSRGSDGQGAAAEPPADLLDALCRATQGPEPPLGAACEGGLDVNCGAAAGEPLHLQDAT